MSGGWSRYTRGAASGDSGCFGSVVAAVAVGGAIGLIVAIVQTPRENLIGWVWLAGLVAAYFALSWLVRRGLS